MQTSKQEGDMRSSMIRALVVVVLAALCLPARAQAPDRVLVNGKIITVDGQFRIAQALAIRGQRIVAVGTTAEIERLKGPTTQTIDLNGRTVIPGLIDNHAHWIRAAEHWHQEVRLDGVTTRAQAVKMLTERVAAARPGEWIVALGGWSEEQFTDDARGFPLAALDRIAPNNPIVLQAVYNHSYLNSAAMKLVKIDERTPNPPGGRIEKDTSGKPSGVVRDAGGVAFVAAQVPLPDKEKWIENTRKLAAELNAMGITTWLDAGGRGMTAGHYDSYKYLSDRGELNVRAFWTTIRQAANPEQAEQVIAAIPQEKPFQGNDYFDNVGWGETVYGPVTTQLLRVESNTKPEDVAIMGKVALALARQGLYVNSHVEMTPAIDAFLTQYEAINKERPIKGLRWSFSHLDQINEAQLERMKKLGMSAQIHSRPLIQGALMHKVHGEKAWDMPPFRRVQDSGIVWGLGSDATAVTTSNPFYTLSLAVTGEMIGGTKVNRQTISREEALIAHTRSNAFIVFQEDNLGSLALGKYADLLVLDRDYLTVPAGEIKDIKPLLTMVGGKIVHDMMPK
jgi:predicted amidohydrolase YtcJ